MPAPIVPVITYLFTFFGLLALTMTTVLIGYIDLGWGSMFVAVTIATLKTTLIASFFMHALLESRLVKLVIAGSLVWFLIFVTLTLGDYISRGWLPVPGK